MLYLPCPQGFFSDPLGNTDQCEHIEYDLLVE